MQPTIDEQAAKIQRYETKLKDIIIAYKTQQAENKSLNERLQSHEVDISQLENALQAKTCDLKVQCSKVFELSKTIECLEIENANYRTSVQEIPILKQRINQLTSDLVSEREISKNLKAAVVVAHDQHEASTQNFEVRISDFVSTLKSLHEIHQKDIEKLKKLQLNETCEDQSDVRHFSKVPDALSLEKQLIQRLQLRWTDFLDSPQFDEKDNASFPEKELQPTESHPHILNSRFSEPPADQSPVVDSPQNYQAADSNYENLGKRTLAVELQEAQDHVQLLRNQNVTALQELELVKKSLQIQLTAANNEANRRLSEATSLYEAQLAQVESEARRYREEMLNLLTDKELEIRELRIALRSSKGGGGDGELLSSISSCPESPVSLAAAEHDSGPAFIEDTPSHCGLIHCAEQRGRMAVELKKLRRCKKDLEKLIEMQKINKPQDENRLPESQRTTGVVGISNPETDIHMAYVKNVIFNLLSSCNASSTSSKMAIVKALAMALRFSQNEENALLHALIS